MDDDDLYGRDEIEKLWPYDGPYSEIKTDQAGVAIVALLRYLNNATGKPSALPYAAVVGSVVGSISTSTAMLPQLLTQLSTFLKRESDNPTLYDDRRDRPGSETALQLAGELDDVVQLVRTLAARLDHANELATHLGNDD